MEKIISFLSEYNSIFSLIQFILMFILSLLIFKKTGNIKFLQGVLEDMKYRKESDVTTKTQKFSNKVPVYKLNKETNLLEKEPELLDVDALVESDIPSTLGAILSKFMPNFEHDIVVERQDVSSNVDKLNESFVALQNLKKAYNLPEEMSFEDVQNFAKTKLAELKGKEEALQLVNKEINGDEKKVEQESK